MCRFRSDTPAELTEDDGRSTGILRAPAPVDRPSSSLRVCAGNVERCRTEWDRPDSEARMDNLVNGFQAWTLGCGVTRCDAERRAARHQDSACIVLSPDSADKCEVIDAQPGVAAFSCYAHRARLGAGIA